MILSWASPELYGQSDSIAPYSKGTHHLYFQANFDMNATSLTNEFISDFYMGDFLSTRLREKISARLGDRNFAGYRMDGGLFYIFSPGDFRKKFGYYIGIEEHSLGEIRFGKNLFDLVFFGNESFIDRKLHLDNARMNLMAWQQFKAGIFKTYKNNGNIHQFGFGVALNKGQKHFCVDVHKASFFTQKDAEYVELDLDMDVMRTDTNNSDLLAFNGYGASADLSYNYTDGRNHEFQLRISNIGYIRWDKSPDNFHREKAFRFDGYALPPSYLLNGLADTSFTDAGTYLDSTLQAIYASDRQKAYSVMLPLDVDMIYTYTSPGRHLSVMTQFRCRFFSLYQPYCMLKPGYTWFIKRSSIGIFPVFSIGGYGTFNAGVNISANIGKKFFLEVGTGTLNSLLSPGNSAGLSGTITLFKTL